MTPLSELPDGYDPKKDKIEIVEYDPRWPELFRQEEALLRKVLGPIPGLLIDHCGSTAVPGLEAKPIIDILIRVESRAYWPQMVDPIEGLGYFYWATNPEKDTLYFAKGMPPFGERRTHHIHVYDLNRKKELLFRDYLRTHPEEARQYVNLKRQLAEKFTFDREGYTKAKTEFIEGILKNIPAG